MSDYFKWEKQYTFDIKEIDEQHRYFVLILDNIYKTLLKSTPREEQGKLLRNLVNYAVIHFQTEEKYFDQFNFEGAAEHVKAHQKLKEKVLKFQSDFDQGKAEISSEILDFLEDWLVDHLATMDKKYVECFHAHGLK